MKHKPFIFLPVMKKFLFLLAFMPLVLGGCEDKNGIKYADYPIAGKSYKHIVGSESKYYDIYVFSKNGRCRADGYINYKFIGSIDDYRYWMEGDSVFIDTEQKRYYKFIRMKYHQNYLTYGNDTLRLVQ